mmetsp:Transcript_34634/g.87650  ORF Transcript_34634/g.87650 Transcript_34634/m.87650 type:complete len:638 (-) Transcript_34634:745-2658(-)|eukprot:CAMPEP_0202858540 /NCGR_PEP_ID=MMETSP1391-20130828/1028_1 /ASSEMBLY_ACC=CAM_ASM_000867 /TAXON_ID=1034604 /ORGANISM="Chlamydomonas leiostraca, Strain SAG 11-49" /LENGTH=637 /DNA_ID=CAMNT_0049537465 /DNA_START=344 /DNA_END=2257 /DNA_ORIENTATION=-
MSHVKHSKHHLSAAGEPGWVDGLTSLKAGDAATELMTDPGESGASNATPAAIAAGARTSDDGAGGDAGGSGGEGGAAVGGGPKVGDVTREEDYDACITAALEGLAKELDGCGEVVLEAGAPSGWGPVGLGAAKLGALLARVKDVAAAKSAVVTHIRERTVGMQTPGGTVQCAVADVLVRKQTEGDGPHTPIEVRVAIIGNVDSGKSTMVGVLTRSVLDDGRGAARAKVFKHGHEEATGRTSSIGQHTLCLDAHGSVLNDSMFRAHTCGEYVARAAKVITLVDLAGHEKYFRTTAYGLTGHLPDYACLIVGANMGVVGMCKEHMGVALALKVPVFFVITKVDICPDHILKQTVTALTAILKKPGVRKKPFLVRNVDDVLLCARCMSTDALAPVFLTSSVTGKGLDLVRLFYNLLPQRTRWAEKRAAPAEFVIDETFGVPGVGTVVAGTVKAGTILPNMTLMMGPDIADGSFKPVTVKSIHYKRMPVTQVGAGQTAALALKKVKRNAVRKGMVMVDERAKPAASWEFDADIAILTHATTIQPRYQAVIHCEIIRQAARVVAMDCERLRSGDRACVRFRFMQRPEYVPLNSRFVFREGRTKGIGIVIGTQAESLPPLPPPPAGAGAGAASDTGQKGEDQD